MLQDEGDLQSRQRTEPWRSLDRRTAGGWRADLAANSRRRGFIGAVGAWFLSPGFKVVTLYRWSRKCRRFGGIGRIASQLLWRWGVSATGCYLSPLAEIGPGLSLPHAVGVVVGEGVVISTAVTLYQHVTLGRAEEGVAARPLIGPEVTIYTGAVVIGGVKIGAGAVVGANSVVLHDVPAGATVAGAPAKAATRTDSRPNKDAEAD